MHSEEPHTNPPPSTLPPRQTKIRPPAVRALTRERLTGLVDRLGTERVLLVVAPAGAGKTTLLAQLAAAARGPVAWFWADGSDLDPRSFFERLEHSLRTAIPGLPSGWRGVEDAAWAIETWTGARAVLILDDFHLLRGSAAEDIVERLIEYGPPTLGFIIASRVTPAFNLSRLRVSGTVTEIGPDDLRFRSWEVERLFRDFYRDPLPPEDLLLLTHRTDGWAAGLQLFHLGTRGKHVSQRRRLLASLSSRSKLVRDYLARNVIDELPPELREFLVRTSVMGRLSGPLCDELLGREGSGGLLDDLATRQIVTFASDEEEYRCHEVLRSHLQAALVEQLGEEKARAGYRTAGRLLERAGALAEALHAFCRAEDWEAAGRLLGRQGETLVEGSAAWVEQLPGPILHQDPWLRLATARRYRAEGRFGDAVRAYLEAELEFGAIRASEVCRRERLALGEWLEPGAKPVPGWSGLVRLATVRDPAGARRVAMASLSGPERYLAAGLAALLSGHVADAGSLLTAAAEDPDASPALVAGARLGAAAAILLAGDETGSFQAERAAEEAERLALPWAARVARSLLVLADGSDGRSEVASARLAFERSHDRWGTSLALLVEGLGGLRDGGGEASVSPLSHAATGFQELGAAVLEIWARAGLALALARTGHHGARQTAVRAEAAARAAGIRGAQAVACLALAEVAPGTTGADATYASSAREAAEECGLALPVPAGPDLAGAAHPAPSMVVRCFGRFEIDAGGAPVDLGSLKPRVRQTLRLLALHAGTPVHREVLAAALWPDLATDVATRSLQVAISTLRRVLHPNGSEAARPRIVREGDAYLLAVPADAKVDLLEFDGAMAQGRSARARGDVDGSIAAFGLAVDLHGDGVLPEEGPAEWVVTERDRRQAEACEATRVLAEIHLGRDDPASAAAVSWRGLQLDRYRDELWRLRIAACERAGDLAAAARARREYREVLAELGVPGEDASLAAEGNGERTAPSLNTSGHLRRPPRSPRR